MRYAGVTQLKNHSEHEEVADHLQRFADPSSIEHLVAAIESGVENRSWDDRKVFERRCFFALGEIGTSETWEAIQVFAGSDDEMIARWANKQLERRVKS